MDTLIVDEMGKNVSGAGMDTNVIGTKPGLERPRIGAIYVRSLTPETHGNATGIGQADVMPRHLLEEIDLHSTYMNTFTAKRLTGSKMPLMAENDLQAMQVCLTVRAEEDPAPPGGTDPEHEPARRVPCVIRSSRGDRRQPVTRGRGRSDVASLRRARELCLNRGAGRPRPGPAPNRPTGRWPPPLARRAWRPGSPPGFPSTTAGWWSRSRS